MTTTPLPTSELPSGIESVLVGLEKKYEQLVWYARKTPASDEAYWKGVPEEIKNGALNAASRVEEQYPEEISRLRDSGTGDWEHGFNSGCLAAFRFILTACDTTEYPDEEGDDPTETFQYGGLQSAFDEFPCLDT